MEQIPISLAGYLAPLRAPRLISAEAIAEMAAIAAPLPSSLAHNTFGFEVRLGDDEPAADLLLQATVAHGLDDLGPAAAGRSGEAWARVRDLAAAWSERGSLLHEHLDHVWLEFDVAGGGRTPSAFFGFRDGESLATTEAALAVLVRDFPRGLIADCFDAFPGELEVFQVGAMLGRGVKPIRLCLRARTPHSIAPWRPELAEIVDSLAAVTDYFCLDVDVDEAIHPRIGIECYVVRGEEEPLLDSLARHGLCTVAKHKALLAWRGVTPSDPDCWPEELLAAETFLGSRARSILTRSVHHVKVVWDEQPIEAKAYLACDYGWT